MVGEGGKLLLETLRIRNQKDEFSFAMKVIDAIDELLKLRDRLCSSGSNNCINDIEKFIKSGRGLNEFQFLNSHIVCEEEPPRDLAIMKLLYPTLAGEKLYEELYKFDDLIKNFCSTSGSTNYEQTSSQLNEMVKGFKLEDLKNRIKLLVFLRGHIDFTTIRKAYDDWCFIDLMDDVNFRQEYVNKVVEERERPISENLKKNIDKCASLTAQGKQIASKYFEGKVSFQAYCEEIDNASRALNVNLINYNGSEPIKISNILQQEKDISKLDIYCDKNLEIRAYKEDKKRYYKFEEGACYQMTSTWPVEDESGNISTCTMVMNVDSTGITKIVKFDGREFNDESYKKDKKLIEQNKELYIGDSSLCKAVKEFLKKQHGLGCGRENMVHTVIAIE